MDHKLFFIYFLVGLHVIIIIIEEEEEEEEDATYIYHDCMVVVLN